MKNILRIDGKEVVGIKSLSIVAESKPRHDLPSDRFKDMPLGDITFEATYDPGTLELFRVDMSGK